MSQSIIITYRGITPLLVHPVVENHRREEIVIMSERNPEALLFYDAHGRVAIPASWIIRALGMARTKLMGYYPKKKVVEKSIRISQTFVPLTTSSASIPKWVLYSHPRHLGKGSKKIGLVRCPQFNDWGCEVEVEFDDPPISLVFLQKLSAVAGDQVGIGLFSPICGGSTNQFGQFEAIRWRWKEKPRALLSIGEITHIQGSVGCS